MGKHDGLAEALAKKLAEEGIELTAKSPGVDSGVEARLKRLEAAVFPSAGTTVTFPPSERWYVDQLYGPFDWDSANHAARLIMDGLLKLDTESDDGPSDDGSVMMRLDYAPEDAAYDDVGEEHCPAYFFSDVRLPPIFAECEYDAGHEGDHRWGRLRWEEMVSVQRSGTSAGVDWEAIAALLYLGVPEGRDRWEAAVAEQVTAHDSQTDAAYCKGCGHLVSEHREAGIGICAVCGECDGHPDNVSAHKAGEEA